MKGMMGNMRIAKASLCAAAGLLASLACANDAMESQRVVDFDFKGTDSANGWGKTKSIIVEPQGDCLKLTGSGWDSKIFRAIDLAPGDYLLAATGKGQALHVRITDGLSPRESLFDMNLTREEGWRNDWRPFSIKKPGKYVLQIHLFSGGKTEAFIKQVKIDRAAPPSCESGVPQAETLEKLRPDPAIVRGCTCPRGSNLADLRAWNSNVTRKFVRLKPSRYVDGLAEYDSGWEATQLANVESYLEDARKCGMKAVLTMDGDVFHEDNRHNACWENPKLGQTVAFVWKGIAQRLLPYRDVIYGYDLYNEPLDWDQMPHPPRQWRGVAEEAIKAIREIDKETWVVYESGPGGMYSGLAEMNPLNDTRVLYSVHFYSPYEFTHQGIYNIKGTDLAEAKTKLNVHYPGNVNGFEWNKESIKESLSCVRQFQRKWHVQILVGEFSVIRWSPKPDAQNYLKDLIDIFEDYHWSWIYHGFREYDGWSVEHDDNYPVDGRHCLAKQETERAGVLKAGLSKNNNSN